LPSFGFCSGFIRVTYVTVAATRKPNRTTTEQ
jgi:hypothetical protein